jgi:DNA-binding NtrC family response regulator
MATDSTEKTFPFEILVVEDAKEVRDIVVWLLRSAGYRALAATDHSVVQSLFLRRYPLLVVGNVSTAFPDGFDLLAFFNMVHPHIPVLIVPGTAFGRWPEVERWASGFPRRPCGADRFQTRVRRLISHVTTRQKIHQSASISGKSPDGEFHANSNPSARPFSLLHSHAAARR